MKVKYYAKPINTIEGFKRGNLYPVLKEYRRQNDNVLAGILTVDDKKIKCVMSAEYFTIVPDIFN